MNARAGLKPVEVEPIRVGRALRQSANDDAITLREKLREATELDAVQSGKQERDQMRSELWGDV